MLREPFEPATNNITIFCGGKKKVPKESWDRKALYLKIKEGDRIVGNGGYASEPSKIVVWRDEHTLKHKKFLTRVCSCQETIFKGLKDWRSLKHHFTYGRGTKDRMEMHKMVVEAIAVIRQYDYENGHPPFEVCESNLTKIV